MNNLDPKPQFPKSRTYTEFGNELFECDDCGKVIYGWFRGLFFNGCTCENRRVRSNLHPTLPKHRFMLHKPTHEESLATECEADGILDLLAIIKGYYIQLHGTTPFTADVSCDLIKLTNKYDRFTLIMFNNKPFGYMWFG